MTDIILDRINAVERDSEKTIKGLKRVIFFLGLLVYGLASRSADNQKRIQKLEKIVKEKKSKGE